MTRHVKSRTDTQIEQADPRHNVPVFVFGVDGGGSGGTIVIIVIIVIVVIALGGGRGDTSHPRAYSNRNTHPLHALFNHREQPRRDLRERQGQGSARREEKGEGETAGGEM